MRFKKSIYLSVVTFVGVYLLWYIISFYANGGFEGTAPLCYALAHMLIALIMIMFLGGFYFLTRIATLRRSLALYRRYNKIPFANIRGMMMPASQNRRQTY